MANTVSAMNPEKWMSNVQDFLNAMLVSEGICNMRKFEDKLSSGDQINWPYINDQRVQSYTPGTDLTIDDFTATQSSMTIDQSKASTLYVDPQEVKQAEFKGYPEMLARQAAFVLAQELDQNVLSTGINGANNSVTGGTLGAGNIYSKLTDAMAELQRANAADGVMFAVLDPERVALLAQNEVANGWNVADNALMNGFVGDSQAGFRIFRSNNLPTSCTLTMDTQPTATDTVTICGVTWTFVADGTTANAGEINVGADLADCQAILPDAINNGSSKTTDWTDVSTANRRKYQNAQVSMGAFAANDSIITAYGKQGNSETFTAATNVFGTETGNLLFGRTGAISVGRQMKPSLYIKPEPKQLGDNYITHHLYGTKVFTRDEDRLCAMSINV